MCGDKKRRAMKIPRQTCGQHYEGIKRMQKVKLLNYTKSLIKGPRTGKSRSRTVHAFLKAFMPHKDGENGACLTVFPSIIL